MKICIAVVMLLTGALANAEDDVFTFRPAHWVDSDDLQPTFYVSPFQTLAFPSPTEGWIAGERYVLHIQGEQLEVAFVDLGESVTSFGFTDPTRGWAGAEAEERGPILRYQGGQWSRERPPAVTWPWWGVHRIMPGRLGDAWASAWFRTEPYREGMRMGRPQLGLLRFDGTAWRIDDQVLAGRTGVYVNDACQAPDDSWWFVGVDFSAPSGMAMIVGRWDGQNLEMTTPATDQRERSNLGEIRCLPDGTAWAMGQMRPRLDTPRDILLLRYTKTWERVPVPSLLPGEPEATAFGVAAADDVWISANCGPLDRACCERFLRYRGGSWETVSLPLMPGGRCTGVRVDDMQFVSPDEAWAVGTDTEPYLGAGRIFHYKNGAWRLRNWNWHFWDAPWFNLFG
jgi:hypothetical protein